MTRAELRTLVLAMVAVDGAQYLATTDTSGLNTLIDRGLAEFCEKSRCLYRDDVALTLATNTSLYDLRGAATDYDVLLPLTVRIEDYPVARTPMWDPYLDVATGRPTRWSLFGPSSIRFNRVPDQVYTATIGGFVAHGSFASDSASVLLNPEDHTALAKYIAALLLGPFARGDALGTRRLYEQEAEAHIQELRAKSDKMVFNAKYRNPLIRKEYHLA